MGNWAKGVVLPLLRALDHRVMDHETESSIQAAADQILKEVRLVGALGEILALFEGMGGPVRLEPDCLGVIGAEIAERVAGVLEAVERIRDSLIRPASAD